MKHITLFIIMACALLTAQGQVRTPKLTVYPSYQPSLIQLTDGRTLRQPLTNIFLKNSALLYMNGVNAMEANMANIVSVKFDDRLYVKIDTLLAYQVDSVGHDALFCATVIDQEAYVQQLKNNQVFTNIAFGADQLGTTTMDISNEDDYKFPLINIYYFRMQGKYVRCHERNLGRVLNKDKKRIMKTMLMLPDFSWTDEKSLLKLLKGLQ